MFVTEEEAAEIYARACRRWYGVKAKSVVSSKIEALKAKGNHKGVKAWNEVHRSLKSQELWANFTSNGARQKLFRRNVCRVSAARTMPAGPHLGTHQR